jgi:hypothetical protein
MQSMKLLTHGQLRRCLARVDSQANAPVVRTEPSR